MTNFTNKLKSIINESASTAFINNQITLKDSENDPSSTIAAAGPLYGLKLISNSEGILSFVTYSKVAIEQFTKYLDDSEDVEIYDISITITDPFSKEGEVITDFDFDTVQESEFVEFNIDVALVSAYVNYNPYYSDDENVDWYTTEHPFEYPIENDGEYSDYYDYIDQDSTPILINVSSTKSSSPYGSFMVTVHPDDNGKILIQCNYETDPIKEDVEGDLDIINNGIFGARFEEEFELIEPAKYIDGSLSTTAAIYKARNSKDAISLVECFENVNLIKYSHELHEVEKIIKVNFKGKKRYKMQCKKGYKYDPERKACVLITGSQLAVSRIAHRQMSRTKKSMGSGYKTRIVRKMKRAKRFRKLMGI